MDDDDARDAGCQVFWGGNVVALTMQGSDGVIMTGGDDSRMMMNEKS